MKNLFIIKRITEDKTISDEAFIVWCGLRNIMTSVKEYFISFNLISYSVWNRVPTRREIESVKRGFNELVNKEYIKVIDNFNKSDFIVDLSALYYEKGSEYFSDLTEEEMHKIMNIDYQGNCKLLRYFTCQIGSFNRSDSVREMYKGKIGGMGLDYFANMINITKPTVIAYNNILMNNKILYVHSHGDFYQGTNSFGQSTLREIPNTYARYEDMKLALDFDRNTHGYKFHKVESIERKYKANERRKLGQKLRYFKSGVVYDIETIKELYAYAEEKNSNMLAAYNTDIANGYNASEPEYIPMDIFDDYLLEICEVWGNKQLVV